jgi:phosphoribosyl 1,2-cyclic phosphodiesterase
MTTHSSLTVCVLGSSSAGNSTLVRDASASVLVDCGFSPSYMMESLAAHGLDVESLSAVLITHTHSDHVNDWFVKKLVRANVPIYCPPQIERHLQAAYESMAAASRLKLLKTLGKGDTDIAGMQVRSFEVPHDSPGGCFGYSLSTTVGTKKRKVSITTDIASPTDTAVKNLANSDVLVIESNHDLEMLEKSGRPAWLKRRIRETGHLSNNQCADLLLKVCDASSTLPESIMLAHVSQQCNTNALARDCSAAMLDARGLPGISLLETHPHTPSGSALLQ